MERKQEQGRKKKKTLSGLEWKPRERFEKVSGRIRVRACWKNQPHL